MGRSIISYQEVLSSLLKNVNHPADEAVLCNHSTNGQLLRTSVLTGWLCFGAPWNFCLSLNCDSWAAQRKLFFWISLVLSSLLSVILNTCFGSLVTFWALLFYSPIFSSPVCAYYGEVWWAEYGAPHIRKSVPCELYLLGYIILQMAQRKKMGPRKNGGSYWDFKEQGNGQLQSIQSFQHSTNNTRALC